MTSYALSNHLPRLAVAMEFRNLHLDVPKFQAKLRSEGQAVFQAGEQHLKYACRCLLVLSSVCCESDLAFVINISDMTANPLVTGIVQRTHIC